MKIKYHNTNFQSNTGPNTFVRRLAMQLHNVGHEPVDSDEDVNFVTIESMQSFNKPMLHRLDGIWFKPEDIETKNVFIKKTYKSADVVVWQSEFDKSMTIHHWGLPKNGVIIRNGIKIEPITSFSSPELKKIRQEYKHVFVCSANWRPNKRCEENIELFQHLRDNVLKEKSCMIVMGENPPQIGAKDVFYTGSIPQRICLEVYSMADWMIHLAWLDHCPNTVVECISQGTPIICSNQGGTAELVGGFGIVLKETNDYNFEPVNYVKPPKLDIQQINHLPNKNDLSRTIDVSIERSALEYESALKSILC